MHRAAGRAGRTAVLASGGALLALAALLWVVLGEGGRRGAAAPPPGGAGGVSRPAAAARGAHWGVGLEQLRHAVPRAPADSPAADPAAEVERALLLADRGIATDADALEAERLLAAALRARPELAAHMARALGLLRDRRLAFRLALLLGRHLTDPEVRAALLEALERGQGHAREVAAYAVYGLRGDTEVAAALGRGFVDAAAGEAVREAHAFALGASMPDLPAELRQAVRAEARAVAAGRRGAGPALRAEAVGLLDPHGEDRAQLWELLRTAPEREVALAAARMLLTRGGAAEAEVLQALSRFAAGGEDATARALRALIEERRRRLEPPPSGREGAGP
ncbi:MAG: hypothetical protein KatS3mg102_0044 [Planctomycetota bacterium]|nr:MAG: hypothetical protein KatS3mg102_0044 [Planctomycetota bacterium]